MTPYPADPEWARGPMRIVMTTFPNRERALEAVGSAVAGHLAACGSVLPVESRYWWKGAVVASPEALVIFKTVPKRVGALFRYLAEHHPYNVPEIIELDVPRAAPSYLTWLGDTLDRSSGPLSGDSLRRPGELRARGARAPARTRAPHRRRSKRTGSR
jgi:periplasmic divalent cation tolerance protein